MYTFKKHTKSIKELYTRHKRNKGKPTKGEVKTSHKIRRPNSLKIVPSGVTNCRDLPFSGGTKRPFVWAKDASSIEGKRVESPPTFIQGKHQKNQKDDDLCILKMRVRELFLRTGKVLVPHVSITRDDNL